MIEKYMSNELKRNNPTRQFPFILNNVTKHPYIKTDPFASFSEVNKQYAM